MKKIKNYQIGLDSEVFAVSLVEAPAVDSNFIYLEKQKPIFLETDEKHMIYGCALRPDYPIYRRYEDEEFYITFSKECVERLSQNFLKNSFQANWTTDHKDVVENLSVVESWIKTDLEKDKSIALGLDSSLPVGTWFIGCKCENEDVWNRVKSGDFGGFSVEAFVSLDEINLSKDMKSNFETIEVNENFWTKIATVIKEALKTPETPDVEAQVTAAEAVEDLKDEVKPEEPAIESIPTEVLADEVSGETSGVTEVVEDTVDPEAVAEEVVTEVVDEAPNEAAAQEDLQTVINELNIKIDELNAQIEELKAQNVKLSKQPSAKPVNTHLAKVEGSRFDRMLSIMNGTAFK